MKAQNTTKNNTKTKHTDLSYHTGSCMAHLNCLPPRLQVSTTGSPCWPI